jgi:hypothetical protein
MYLRRHDKSVNGEDYGYWSLVESVRTARGPRQRIVATIGKLPGLDKEERVGWEEIGRILDGKPRSEPELFEKSAVPPLWATVNINQVSVERLRHFGDVYLALLLWSKLGFAEFCKEHLPGGREDIPWSIMVCILVLARFCAPSSELQIAESWYDKTALGSRAKRSTMTDFTGRWMPFCRTKTSYVGTFKAVMASCLALPLTSFFTT